MIDGASVVTVSGKVKGVGVQKRFLDIIRITNNACSLCPLCTTQSELGDQ